MNVPNLRSATLTQIPAESERVRRLIVLPLCEIFLTPIVEPEDFVVQVLTLCNPPVFILTTIGWT